MSNFEEFGSRERLGWSDSDIVDAYIKHFAPITDFAGKHIADHHIKAGDNVLDLCCGQGTLTAIMSGNNAKITGLDFSPEMIAKAKLAAPNADILEGDAMAMPFADAQFDKVVCNFGIMHIPDQPRALSEIRRVLKPNGKFIMATWVGPTGSPAFAAVFGALKLHADFSVAPPQPDLFAFADPDQATEMLASANLEMEGHHIVEAEWILDKPTELFNIFLNGTVGARMLIKSQTEDTIERIAATVAKNVSENFIDGSKYRVTVPIAVISAQAN